MATTYQMRGYDAAIGGFVYWNSVDEPDTNPTITSPKRQGVVLHNVCIIDEQTLGTVSTRKSFVIDVSSEAWTIDHNFNCYPIVLTLQVNDKGEREIIVGDVVYISLSQIKIYFSTPQTGEVYLS